MKKNTVLSLLLVVVMAIIVLFSQSYPSKKQLISTFDSSHEQIVELEVDHKQLSDTERIYFAVYDPEVQMVQVCIQSPRGKSLLGKQDVAFTLDEATMSQLTYVGHGNYLWHHYFSYFFKDVGSFTDLAFNFENRIATLSLP